jgi:hypothetical protein
MSGRKTEKNRKRPSKGSSPHQFSFYSVQEHSQFLNGKSKTVRKEVNIQNGKGTKKVIIRNNSKRTRRSVMPIKKDELEKIRRNIFVPGLFNECINNCK